MANLQKQHGVSGKGIGKWHSLKALARYRRWRDQRIRQAKLSRRKNRV